MINDGNGVNDLVESKRSIKYEDLKVDFNKNTKYTKECGRLIDNNDDTVDDDDIDCILLEDEA